MKKVTTAERLNQLMQERNLKQIDIVNLSQPFCKQYDIKIGRNDISQYLSGKVEPGQNKLFILGKALNVSEAWLMGFDVPKEAQYKENSQVHDSLKEDVELQNYLEELRTRPEMKMLFNVTKSATKDEIEKAVKIIETMLDK